MPFVPMTKQQQEQDPNQAVNISGGGANFADVVPGQEKKEKSSGSYANLQKYIQANQPQAQQMGQNLSQNVESAGQQASQKVEQFGQQKPQVAEFDPNQYIQNAPQLSQEQKTQYQQTKATGGYTGPQQLEQAQGYTEAQKAAQEAANKAKMAGTESGQQELLKQTYARPDYTQGQVKLDQVLLGGNQQAKQSLGDLSQRYSGLYDLFNQKAEDVGTGINQATQQALKNREAVVLAEQKALQDLINPIESRVSQAMTERPQAQQRVFEDISDDLLFQDTLDRLGIGAGQSLYDLNLANYVTPNQTALTVNDLANQQERERYQALRDLFQNESMSQIGQSGQVTQPISFNKAAFEKDVQSKAAGYKSAYENDRIFPGGATAKEMEEIYIPRAQAFINSATNDYSRNQWQNALNTALQQVAAFKNQYKPTRKVGVQS